MYRQYQRPESAVCDRERKWGGKGRKRRGEKGKEKRKRKGERKDSNIRIPIAEQ
jgi:hypothetical protein